MDVSMIGLDTAKKVFQVHAVDEAGKLVMRRQIQRSDLISSKNRARRPLLWRRAALRIIGGVRWWGLDIT
jgi:hypothetical protein